MARQRSSQPVSPEGTLFGENFVDTLVAEQGSSREVVFQELGLELPKAEVVRQSLAQVAVNPLTTEPILRDEVHPDRKEVEMPLDREDIDPATSMRLLHKEYNFYARNAKEKGAMWGILGRSHDNLAYPVVRYLYDVKQKQASIGVEDPFAAPHSIAGKFEGYAIEADMEAKLSRVLDKTIKSRGTGPKQLFSEAFTADDYKNDPLTRRTLTSVIRLIEADLFAKEGVGEYPLDVRNGVDSLKGDESDDYVLSILDKMPLGDILNYNRRLHGEETNRFNFWHAQLLQARMWSPVREQVDKSIKKLDEIRPRRSA